MIQKLKQIFNSRKYQLIGYVDGNVVLNSESGPDSKLINRFFLYENIKGKRKVEDDKGARRMYSNHLRRIEKEVETWERGGHIPSETILINKKAEVVQLKVVT